MYGDHTVCSCLVKFLITYWWQPVCHQSGSGARCQPRWASWSVDTCAWLAATGKTWVWGWGYKQLFSTRKTTKAVRCSLQGTGRQRKSLSTAVTVTTGEPWREKQTLASQQAANSPAEWLPIFFHTRHKLLKKMLSHVYHVHTALNCSGIHLF